jgi:WD40 repeat protein
VITDNGGDQFVRVWDVSSGKEVFAVRPTEGSFSQAILAIDRTGALIAVATEDDGAIRVWDSACHEPVRTLAARFVKAMAFSSDGGRLVVARGGQSDALSGEVTIHELNSGLATAPIWRGRAAVVGVDISPDGRLVVAVDLDGTVYLWKAASGQLTRTFSLRTRVGRRAAVAFDPHNSRLLAYCDSADGADDERLDVLELATGREEQFFHNELGGVQALAFSPDATRLTTAGADRTVKIWDMTMRGMDKAIAINTSKDVYGVAFSHDGRKCFALSDGLHVLDIAKSIEVQHFDTVGERCSVAVNPDDSIVALPNQVRDTQSGKRIVTLEGNAPWCRVAFSHDGQFLAAGRGDQECREVKIWQTTSWKAMTTLKGDTNPVWQLAFSPNGNLLAMATGGWRRGLPGHRPDQPGEVRIWNWRQNALLRTLKATRFCLYTVAFSADGTRIAAGGGLYHPGNREPIKGEIDVWDAESGRTIFSQKGLPKCVFSVALSPDGERLVSGGGAYHTKEPTELQVWDIESGQEVLRLPGHDATVYEVAFSSDGNRIASASGDGTVRIWDGTEILPDQVDNK